MFKREKAIHQQFRLNSYFSRNISTTFSEIMSQPALQRVFKMRQQKHAVRHYATVQSAVKLQVQSQAYVLTV